MGRPAVIIHKPQLCTRLDVWFPRYHDQWTEGERVALLAEYKVRQASPVIIVTFSKAKHLAGQRFCITKNDVLKCQLGTNGKIACYLVPMDAFEPWETAQEVNDIAMGAFE